MVWEWRLWDHLVQDHDPSKDNYGVVSEHPELLDINCVPNAGADWNHGNSVVYNPSLDQIMINLRSMNEFYVIDHSTTTEQASRPHGGTLRQGRGFLVSLGQPADCTGAERSQTRDSSAAHHPHWIEEGLPGAGEILIFNNGRGRADGNYSSVDQIRPPVTKSGEYSLAAGGAYGPADLEWSYAAEPKSDFYSHFISGSQRLPNGNTLICSGAWSRLFEVTPAGEIVWEYRAAYGRPDAPRSAGGMLEDGGAETGSRRATRRRRVSRSSLRSRLSRPSGQDVAAARVD